MAVEKDLEQIGENLADSVLKDVEDVMRDKDTASEASDDEAMDETLSEDNATLLACASSLKDAGNLKLKSGNFGEAAADYREGLKKLDRRGEDGSAEHQALQIALNSNLSLACLKNQDYFEGAQAASAALKKNSQNTKVLLRRAICYKNMGDYDEARKDLLSLLAAEPKNLDARKELSLVKEKIIEAQDRQRASFQGLFTKSVGYYDDKEKEKEKRQEEERKLMEENRRLWKEAMADKNPGDSTYKDFDQWVKDREELKSQQEKKKERGGQRQTKKTQDEPMNQKRSVKDLEKDIKSKGDRSLDLDEEDLKILEETKKKGYCYFRRELTEEEKSLRETQHVPQKIDPALYQPQATSSSDQKRGVSEWNSAGTTFEEKDTSQWCLKMLKGILTDVGWESDACNMGIDQMMNDPLRWMKVLESIKGGVTTDQANSFELMNQIVPMKANITGEPHLKGEAQVMVVRGTKRHFFDYSMNARWKVQLLPSIDGQGERIFEGKLTIDELNCSDAKLVDNIKIYRDKSEEALSDIDRQLLDFCYGKLKVAIVDKIQEFEKIYQDRQR